MVGLIKFQLSSEVLIGNTETNVDTEQQMKEIKSSSYISTKFELNSTCRSQDYLSPGLLFRIVGLSCNVFISQSFKKQIHTISI